MDFSPQESPQALPLPLHQRAMSWLKIHARPVRRAVWVGSAALILVVIAYQIARNWLQIRDYPWQLRPLDMLLALGIYSVSLLLTAFVWAAVIMRMSDRLPLLIHMRLFCLTNLANRLPTPLPYIGARIEAYAAEGIARPLTLTAMALEMVVKMVSAVIIAGLTLSFGPKDAITARFSPLIWLALLPLAALMFRPAWLLSALNVAFKRFKRPPIEVQPRTYDMLVWTVLSAMIWVNGGILYYFLIDSIFPVTPNQVLFMINVFTVSGIVGWLGQFFFFVPNLALRQLVVAYLLSLAVPWPVAVAGAILTRLCVMVFELVWALLFSLIIPRPRER